MNIKRLLEGLQRQAEPNYNGDLGILQYKTQEFLKNISTLHACDIITLEIYEELYDKTIAYFKVQLLKTLENIGNFIHY